MTGLDEGRDVKWYWRTLCRTEATMTTMQDRTSDIYMYTDRDDRGVDGVLEGESHKAG